VRYQTEYRLGRRGHVCRTASGIQALGAIAFDLALGLIFGLIGHGWRKVRCLSVTTCRIAVALAGLPLRAARAITGQAAGRPVVKPKMEAFDEFSVRRGSNFTEPISLSPPAAGISHPLGVNPSS
jgi:hypothetical protein